MSPAAGGAAASFDPAPAPTAAIGAPPHHPENLRDPAFQADGADPGNAAARKPAWNVPPPPPAAPVGGGIIGGDESWPALTESAAPARAWPKSASSDSLSDGSAPSAPEDSVVVPSVPSPSQPVSNPISTAPSPASTSPPPPPPSATTTPPSPQNGGPIRPDLVRHGGGQGGNNGGGGRGGNNGGADHGGNGGGGSGSTRSRSTGNNSSDGNSSSGGDGNWNDGGLGGGSSNMNSSVQSSGTGIDSSRRVFGSNNWNSNGRGGGYNNGSGDEGNRNNGGGRGWNNNGRSGSGSSNGFGGRGGGRNRRDHDRGGNFSPRNYSRPLPAQQQQQQPSFYQPGPFQRPPPPPPHAAHFMMPQPFVPYAPPFAYPGDVQNYPFYVTPLEQQFQNMHLIQQQMQPLGAQQDQLSLQHDIQKQIEHYFSTNNLCHDTHLRGRMDDQGWVPIDLIASFPKVTRFLMLGVDTNYILDSLQGSELVEVQGNNIRRRNDWAAWLLHRRPPPSN